MKVPQRSAPPEVREAWREYSEELQKVNPARESEVEPWLWAKLQAKLRALRQKAAA
jgi:hypothetical protein